MDARTVLDPFVRVSEWERSGLASVTFALLAVLGYVGLASRAPATALSVSSAAMAISMITAILTVWPAEAKITLQRQLEVVGYRVLVALVVYFALGFAILWSLNQAAPAGVRVPIAWEGPFLRPWENPFFRRVTFWPFYALVLLGCQGLGPTPPGAC